MLQRLRRQWLRRRLKDQAYAFLFEPAPPGELVGIDCETTTLDIRRAELLSVAAIRIRGDRILTSERLELVVRPEGKPGEQGVLIHQLRPLDIARGVPADQAIDQVLRFIGSRPLVGYYLEFDVAVLDRHVRPKIGIPLPNRQIEVSALYYDFKQKRSPPGANIDLRFATIREELGLPDFPVHDAFNDALLAAMIYLRLAKRPAPPANPPLPPGS
jgi:DNA polymerase III subunit epsilon